MFCTQEPIIQLKLNVASIVNMRECTIQFDRNPTKSVHYKFMNSDMHGVAFGERTYQRSGKGSVSLT